MRNTIRPRFVSEITSDTSTRNGLVFATETGRLPRAGGRMVIHNFTRGTHEHRKVLALTAASRRLRSRRDGCSSGFQRRIRRRLGRLGQEDPAHLGPDQRAAGLGPAGRRHAPSADLAVDQAVELQPVDGALVDASTIEQATMPFIYVIDGKGAPQLDHRLRVEGRGDERRPAHDRVRDQPEGEVERRVPHHVEGLRETSGKALNGDRNQTTWSGRPPGTRTSRRCRRARRPGRQGRLRQAVLRLEVALQPALTRRARPAPRSSSTRRTRARCRLVRTVQGVEARRDRRHRDDRPRRELVG